MTSYDKWWISKSRSADVPLTEDQGTSNCQRYHGGKETNFQIASHMVGAKPSRISKATHSLPILLSASRPLFNGGSNRSFNRNSGDKCAEHTLPYDDSRIAFAAVPEWV